MDSLIRIMPPNGAVMVVGGLLMLAVGCSDTRAVADSATPSTVRHAPTLAYSDPVAIAARADSIDRYITAHPERLKLFAKLSEQTGLVAVKDTTSWPDGTEISYNTATDIDGHRLFHLQVPASESGDWDAEEIHYFAPDGHTILHQFRISGFSSGCVEILREIKRLPRPNRNRARRDAPLLGRARETCDGRRQLLSAERRRSGTEAFRSSIAVLA